MIHENPLEQALHEQKPVSGALVHHSDRSVQYVSIKYASDWPRIVGPNYSPGIRKASDFFLFFSGLMVGVEGLEPSTR